MSSRAVSTKLSTFFSIITFQTLSTLTIELSPNEKRKVTYIYIYIYKSKFDQYFSLYYDLLSKAYSVSKCFIPYTRSIKAQPSSVYNVKNNIYCKY